MKHSRISSYVPSPYSKNSPSSRPQSSTKKTPTNVDSSKGNKLSQADMNIKMQPAQSGSDNSDKKFSPLSKERKSDFTASLYQLSKVLDKDQQTYSKLYKSKETQQKKTQKSTINNRPAEKLNEKLSIYQYVQNKSKKPEDYKSALNVSNQASSRASSRIVVHDEQNDSLVNKVCDANALSSRGFLAMPGSSSQSQTKSKATPGHQKNLSTTAIKGTQKISLNNGAKHINLGQGSAHNLSFNDVAQDYSKTPDAKKAEPGKFSSAAGNFNEALANKLKIALQGLQGDLQNARHRRGLSSGQTPIFIDQQLAQAQEKIKPIELEPPTVAIPVDPQQEQDEFFEKFFHSDKMTFEFEKLIVSQRNNKPQNTSLTATTTPTNQKKPATAHARTRSIEDPNAMMPAKTSSRWNTKRSSVGEEGQPQMKQAYNLMDKLNEFDRNEGEKEDRRRYLRG